MLKKRKYVIVGAFSHEITKRNNIVNRTGNKKRSSVRPKALTETINII